MSAHVSDKKQDFHREKLFKDSFGLNTTIHVTTYNDENWNWDICVINFRDSLGKNYGLIEYFKPGDDNSTDYVILEYEDKEGNIIKENFQKFIDAENSMVALMQRRLKGED